MAFVPPHSQGHRSSVRRRIRFGITDKPSWAPEAHAGPCSWSTPNDFLPYDDRILSLGVSDALPGKETWENYRNEIKKVREMFPGCTPYEINVLVYESSKSKSPLRVNPERCFQISTNVYNEGEDRWGDFSENCWVYTGGPGSKKRSYPLTDPEKGDIILVRFAAKGAWALASCTETTTAKGLRKKHGFTSCG